MIDNSRFVFNPNKPAKKQVYGLVRTGHHFAYGDFTKYNNKMGIYYVRNKVTKKEYVGASTDIRMRLSKHMNQLFRGVHNNKRMQEEFNQYGLDNFEHGIYIECSKDDLSRLEKEKQIEIGVDNLYNLKISHYYIDDNLRNVYASGDKSTHKTKEYKDKMSKLKSNYVAQYTLEGTRIKIWDSVKQIHKELGYTISVISSVCNGWKKRAYGYLWRYTDSKGNILSSGYGNKQE